MALIVCRKGGFWDCQESDTRSETLFRTEAAIYALSQMSEQLRISFGAVIINTCYKEIRAVTLALEILHGTKKISWNGTTLNPDTIVAIISDYSSDITRKVIKFCYVHILKI